MTDLIKNESVGSAQPQNAGGEKRRKRNKYGLTLANVIFIVAFCIVPVLHFCIFYLFANFRGFLMAFQKPIGYDGDFVWTLDQFRRVFDTLGQGDSELRIALKNTFITFGFSLIMFPCSIIISYFLYKQVWGYKTFKVIFYMPHIVSGLVTSYVFISMVSTRGFIAPLIQKWDHLSYLPSLLADSDYANSVVLFHMVWLGLPGNMILWCGTFARIPTSVLEYGKLDGVGWVRELVQLILPLIWPTFSLLLMMQFTSIFSASGAVFLLTQGKWDTQTLSNWFYMQVYNANGDANTSAYNYMSAFGMLITVPACAISLFVRFVLAKLVEDVEY
ncbi:MAG: sugar ABC transporter permease [Clostridia bacterium]|nr:sugar ABC transporter permease [Clostridia bacterium]